ncbi:MAG TPA: hypothetical protein VK638_21495 [Edaphobacter sp.]|nr:hypothetical protein [Edaphobacter sp.]
MVTVWRGWKLCKWVLTSLLVIYLVLLAAVQISQRIMRRRAEHLLSDLRGLQLERSSWSDAQALMQRWGRWGHYEGTCDADHCDYWIHFDSVGMVTGPIVISERFFNLFIRSEKMATTMLGAHLPSVEGGFRLQNNLVVGTWFSLATNVPGGGGPLFSRVIGTRTRDLERYNLWPEKDPHSEYRTVLRSGTIGYFFTEFTAATKQKDVEWLTAVNFSCMTRWVPCREMGDLLPSAWAKYKVERKRVSAIWDRIGACAYPLKDLIEASERVALVQVEKPNAQKHQWSPYPARLVESLKGSSSWHSGDARHIWSGLDPVAPTEILLFTEDSDPVYPHDCGVIPATPENLRTVKAAVEGDH